MCFTSFHIFCAKSPLTENSYYGKDVTNKMDRLGLFDEYCDSSTIHGVKYFGGKRHLLERVWWIFVFGLSLYGCGRLISNVYVKWDESPVIISIDEKFTPIWEIPFPAVTICPITKANMTQLNVTKVFNAMFGDETHSYNVTEEEEKFFAAVIQVCPVSLGDGLEYGEHFTNNSITDLLKKTAASMNDTMLMGYFRNTEMDIPNNFIEIMTEEGLCFTFNMLNKKELYTESQSPDFAQTDHNMSAQHWSQENGYHNIQKDPQTYPLRIFESGPNYGLIVFLQTYELNLDYLCSGAIQGFNVHLHTPGEVPQPSKDSFILPLQQAAIVSVKPNIIKTSEGLRHFEPNRRQCYFDSERKLRFMKVYTQRNCELECLANVTLEECGCVKFSMPRDANTPICGPARISCYYKAEKELVEVDTLFGSTEAMKRCNCLPACNSITYEAEITQHPFEWENWFKANRIPLDEISGKLLSVLRINFNKSQFTTLKRSEFYSYIDFLANCGGLLGLFMGASFLSIVEFVYFFSLRWCCILRARMNRNKIAESATPEIIVVKAADDRKIE